MSACLCGFVSWVEVSQLKIANKILICSAFDVKSIRFSLIAVNAEKFLDVRIFFPTYACSRGRLCFRVCLRLLHLYG